MASGAAPPPVVLASHGSRDPASAATMRALAMRVGERWPGPVVAAFLDFDRPSIPDALAGLPSGLPPVVVPALLTHAYHGRVDLPAVLAAAPRPTRVAPVLGPDPLLVTALQRRLSELLGGSGQSVDAVLLIAAGTSDAPARSTVDEMAARLGGRVGVAYGTAFASASGPTPGEAVVALRAGGARRIAVASYFLAPGRLYDAAARSARSAGVLGVAAPLGTADEVVELILARAQAGAGRPDPGREKAPALVPGHFA